MGGVIRRESLSGRPHFSFADLEQQARELIARAEERAQRIVAESEGHIRQVTEAHKREGYAAGLAEGRAAGFAQALKEGRAEAVRNAEAELRQLTSALRAGLAEYDRQKRALLAAAESGLIELALAVARRVCKLQAEHGPDVALANARALLDLVRNRHDLVLHLNPVDHELLPDDVPQLLADVADLAHVTIVPDPAVARGGCALYMRDGTIEADLAGQLDRVAAALCGDEGPGNAAPEEPAP